VSQHEVTVPFDPEMSYSEPSSFSDGEIVSDEGEEFSSDTLDILSLMETVR
jgi:hypothetical protein